MWFICLRRSILSREQWTVSVDEHLAWMKQMHDAGSIIMSGPGKGPDGTPYGMYLIRAASKAEAEQVAGHCAFDLIEWEVHQIMGAGGFSMAAMQGLREPGPRLGIN